MEIHWNFLSLRVRLEMHCLNAQMQSRGTKKGIQQIMDLFEVISYKLYLIIPCYTLLYLIIPYYTLLYLIVPYSTLFIIIHVVYPRSGGD